MQVLTRQPQDAKPQTAQCGERARCVPRVFRAPLAGASIDADPSGEEDPRVAG